MRERDSIKCLHLSSHLTESSSSIILVVLLVLLLASSSSLSLSSSSFPHSSGSSNDLFLFALVGVLVNEMFSTMIGLDRGVLVRTLYY